MMISVVTICKNSSKLIERTIKSVLLQKSDNVEYVVIDGASIDGTVDIVKGYGNNIDVFLSEPDEGISDAFNKGILLSKGEIVSLINSDDTLLPGALHEVQKIFEENPDIEVLHGDIYLYKEGKLVKQVKPAGRWWHPWRLVLYNHPATFVRRQVYEKHGLFSLDYKFAMDVDIFLRWMRHGVKIHYLNKPLVAMYYGGVSDRFPFEGYRESKRAFLSNGFPQLYVSLLFAVRPFMHYLGRVQAFLLSRSST